MKTLFLLCFALFLHLTLQAEDYAYCLGRLDLAGMPPATLPPQGQSLQLNSTEQALQNPEAEPIGFLPAVYREAFIRMQERQVTLEFIVVHTYPTPEPGKFVQIEVWATPKHPADLEPLLYKVPLLADQE